MIRSIISNTNFHPCPAAGSGPDLPLDIGNLVDAIDDEYTYDDGHDYDYGYESEEEVKLTPPNHALSPSFSRPHAPFRLRQRCVSGGVKTGGEGARGG